MSLKKGSGRPAVLFSAAFWTPKSFCVDRFHLGRRKHDTKTSSRKAMAGSAMDAEKPQADHGMCWKVRSQHANRIGMGSLMSLFPCQNLEKRSPTCELVSLKFQTNKRNGPGQLDMLPAAGCLGSSLCLSVRLGSHGHCL